MTMYVKYTFYVRKVLDANPRRTFLISDLCFEIRRYSLATLTMSVNADLVAGAAQRLFRKGQAKRISHGVYASIRYRPLSVPAAPKRPARRTRAELRAIAAENRKRAERIKRALEETRANVERIAPMSAAQPAASDDDIY